MYVEVDFSKGLPNHIILIHNNVQLSQPIDFENTMFRCRCYICLQTRHLQNSRPQEKEKAKTKKIQAEKPKGWKFSNSQEVKAEEEEILENTRNNVEQNSHDIVKKYERDKNILSSNYVQSDNA